MHSTKCGRETRGNDAKHYCSRMRGDDDWSVGRRRWAAENPWRSNDSVWFGFERCGQVDDCVASSLRLSPVRSRGLGFSCEECDVARVKDVGAERLDDKRFIDTSDQLSA